MTKIDRRSLLAFAGTAVVLSACSMGASVPAFVAAIQAVGQEAKIDIPLLQAAGVTVPSGVLSALQGIMDLAAGVGSVTTVTQGQNTLGKIEAYVNQLAPLVVPLLGTLNPALGGSLALIAAALPAVEALLNMAVSQLSPVVGQLAQNAPTPTKSVVLLRAPMSRPSAQDYLGELLARHS